MSEYSTVHGHIVCSDPPDDIIRELKAKGWMNDDNKFIDECKEVVLDDGTPDVQGNSMRIPLGYYRNFVRILPKISRNTNGTIVWTSTDGDFCGGVIIDGKQDYYDLTDWARHNIDVSPPDYSTDFDGYTEWMDQVEREFHDEFLDDSL